MMKYFIWLLMGAVLGVGGYWLFLQYYSLPQVPQQVPQHDDLPVIVGQTILVYFNKNEPTDIVQVAVKRTIPNRVAVAHAAIQKLLDGPTANEMVDNGLSTAINSGTIVNYVKINNGVATVDFNDKFDFQMGGSARVGAIYQQIYKTLTQFPTIKSIKITINNGERPANLEP